MNISYENAGMTTPYQIEYSGCTILYQNFFNN